MHTLAMISGRPPEQRARRARPQASSDEAGRRPRLLIVEDDAATQSVLCRFFRRIGWDVRPATTVAEGLALIDARTDWVILDLNLPDGDGADVLLAIREAGLPARVIIASATADDEHLARVARLGPDSFLAKPFDFDTLLCALGEAG